MSERRTPTHSPRSCKICGTEFIPRSSRGLYCSRVCRRIVERGRRKDSPAIRQVARERAAQWRARNRERHRAYSTQWVRTNPQRYRANMRVAQRRRRARSVGGGVAEVEYAAMLRGDPCSYCGGAAGEVDHIEPVAEGGANRWENLTAACKSCNSRKRTRSVLTFLREVLP